MRRSREAGVRRGQKRGELVEPIARWERGTDGEILLLDPTAMRIHFQIDDRTVRRYEPVACDRATRAPLYHEQQVAELRATVRRRTSRRARQAA
jgi:hypothetical protein